MVDAATFVDPVVPVDSQRAAGAVVKKGMRTVLLWYVGWITHQISQFASAVSRSLHIVEGRLKELERKVEVQRVPGAGVVEMPALHRADAWWVAPTVAAVASVPGRIVHAASGDGWLVRRIIDAGGDAYGVDPRTNLVEQGVLTVSDLRGEDLADHLRAVAPAGLGAIVLSGVVDGMAGGERTQLLHLIGTTLAPGGVLVVHSLSRASWDARGRAVRGRPGPRPAPAGGDVAAPARTERVPRHGDRRSRRGRLPGHRRQGHRCPARADRGAVSAAGPPGPPVAVHQFIPTLNPRDATGSHTLLAARHPAGGRVALGDLRRGDPRRPGHRGVQALDVPRPRGGGRRRHLPVLHLVGGGAASWRERSEPLIVDFHNFTGARALPRLGAAQRGTRRPGPRRPRPAGAAGRVGPGRQPLQRARPAACRLPPHRGGPGPGGLPAGGRRRPIAGWRPQLAAAKAGGGADLLFVGRIVPSKGQHELVKALWAYRRLYDPAARLHLVGGTSSFAYLKALRGFIAELGLADAVRITGDVSDAALAAYFAAADAYLSLSAHEGFGVPLVEAMAAGVPVVARDVGAVAETVGDAALLLRGTDPSYVAAALHRACTDGPLRQRAGRGRTAASAGVRPRRRDPAAGGGGRLGGRSAPMKVVFVTPRYGPQVMGGAETAARQLAEHLIAETDWEAEAYSTCALDPHTWADELEPGDLGDQRGAGAPLRLGPRAARRLLRARRASPPGAPDGPAATRAGAGSTTTARSRPTSSMPWWPRTPTWSRSTRTCTTRRWRPSGR